MYDSARVVGERAVEKTDSATVEHETELRELVLPAMVRSPVLMVERRAPQPCKIHANIRTMLVAVDPSAPHAVQSAPPLLEPVVVPYLPASQLSHRPCALLS